MPIRPESGHKSAFIILGTQFAVKNFELTGTDRYATIHHMKHTPENCRSLAQHIYDGMDMESVEAFIVNYLFEEYLKYKDYFDRDCIVFEPPYNEEEI